ncbi:hypothetical protein HPC49_15215 [Pyxidicoccus fallax]|uniref:Lipoprotein n=1 Tax=Pyxidicoccus fallax TaxID=394095 RepID=A0A848LIU8_9BACT|nr:hypothetical protein [Pyxidicoccus fallax]NMO17642.1 hypothetical protein [Pyxidicoccus fallax]NPC79568.1 hypothetical protein [Pyxidicoccus fallax]
MKTARPFLVALTALLAVSGCSDSDEPCFFQPFLGDDSRFSPPAYEVGSPVSLQVFAITNRTCDGETDTRQVPDTATAEVFDPENTSLPVEVSLGPSGTSASLRFTPRTTGRHHVLVAFAPVGSVRQLGVYVAQPWTGGEPISLPLPRCTQLDRTSRGTWLCDGVALREPNARPVRLGTATSAPDVAVAGNVVWVVGEGRVRRYVDTGTDLELTGSLLLNASPLTVQSRLATENELLVLDNQTLHRFTFTDTGVLAASGTTRWATTPTTAFGVDSVTGLLVRVAADRLMVVQMQRLPDSRACPFQLGPDGVYTAAPEPCQALPGQPVGYAEGAVWTRVGDPFRTPFAQTLHLWVARNGTLDEQGTLALDSPVQPLLSPLRAGFLIPDIQLGQYAGAFSVVPVVPSRPGPLGMERLPGTPGLSQELRTVSPRFYWEGDSRLSNGTTLVFERPAG